MPATVMRAATMSRMPAVMVASPAIPAPSLMNAGIPPASIVQTGVPQDVPAGIPRNDPAGIPRFVNDPSRGPTPVVAISSPAMPGPMPGPSPRDTAPHMATPSGGGAIFLILIAAAVYFVAK